MGTTKEIVDILKKVCRFANTERCTVQYGPTDSSCESYCKVAGYICCIYCEENYDCPSTNLGTGFKGFCDIQKVIEELNGKK